LDEETKKVKLHGDTERWKEKEARTKGDREKRKKGRRKERKKKCLSVTIRKQIQKYPNILTLKKSKHFRIKALFLTAQRRRHRYFF